MKIAAVTGAVAGGGLTVMPTRPIRSGTILNKHFEDGVGAMGVILGALASHNHCVPLLPAIPMKILASIHQLRLEQLILCAHCKTSDRPCVEPLIKEAIAHGKRPNQRGSAQA